MVQTNICDENTSFLEAATHSMKQGTEIKEKGHILEK